MKSRFEALLTRHRELDREIDSKRRYHDRLPEVSRLKRLRLAIKDEVEGLRMKRSRSVS